MLNSYRRVKDHTLNIAEALAGMRSSAKEETGSVSGKASAGPGDGPLIIASICGTAGDPQNYASERKALEAAGIFVAEHNQGLCELALAALEACRDT